MMKSLKKQETINEFWKNATPAQKADDLDKLIMSFDLRKNLITMESDKKNVNGDPLFEWSLDSDTGDIVETTRLEDATSEKIIERQVSPASLENSEV